MIVDYDYNTFTKKDMFEVKLKDITPSFGHIAASKRIPFLTAMVSLGFVEFMGDSDHTLGYRVIQAFAYESMGDYRPKMFVTTVGDYLLFDQRNRPNYHLKECWSEEKKQEFLDGLNSAKF